MDTFPTVIISGEGRLSKLSELLEKIEGKISELKDKHGKSADEYLADGLRRFDISAYAGMENSIEYKFISNIFWFDELVALAAMGLRGDFTKLHDDTFIPSQIHGMTLFVSQSEAACFLAKVEKVILQKSPARKPRYGKALSDMAFAIVRSKGPLSDSFTKADIKREMAPELARFASIPAQSTIDAAIDKAVKQWETAERARLPKSGKSGKSES